MHQKFTPIIALALAFTAGCGQVEDQGGDPQGDLGGSPRGDAGPRATPDAGLTQTESARVDPGCRDGQYSEALPDPTASLTDVTAAYDPSAPLSFIREVLSLRYPLGRHLIDRGLIEGSSIGDCVEAFLRDRSSAAAVIDQLGTLVHECGHFLNMGLGRGADVYQITEVNQLSCRQGDTTARQGQTFARSRITEDEYGSLRPPCDGSRGSHCDSYADIYLNGDPDDANFDSGDQGLNMLLEETLQYINSLATAYAFADQSEWATSARDGILTHLWWLERYLALARNEHPAAHDFILGDPCWREAILTIWGRAWLYLELTADNRKLGINDEAILELVDDEALLSEIDALRHADGCR